MMTKIYFENREEYQKVIGAIRGARVEAPDDMTLRIMEGLPEGAPNSLKSGVGNGLYDNFNMRGVLSALGMNGSYLFIAGFFHLVLAWGMLMGLKDVSGPFNGWSWIIMQPFVVFFLGMWLMVFAFVAALGGKKGRKAAAMAVLGYIQIIVIDGALPLLKFDNTLIYLPFIALLIGGLAVGGYMVLKLDRANAVEARQAA